VQYSVLTMLSDDCVLALNYAPPFCSALSLRS
jgi:hypothetical protein